MSGEMFVVGDGPGLGPGPKPAKDLPDFGALSGASDQAVADVVLGHHRLGAQRLESECLERFRWVCGYRLGDRASLNAAWLMFRNRSRLVEVVLVGNLRMVERVRVEPFDWKNHKPAPPTPTWTRLDAFKAGADKRAKRIFDALQANEIKRLIREEIGR